MISLYIADYSGLVNKNINTTRQVKPEKPKTKEWIKPLWFLFTIGWYVVLSLMIPAGIGYWLDRPGMFDSHPLYTLIGFGIGTVITFFGLYRMLRQFYNEQKNQAIDKESK